MKKNLFLFVFVLFVFVGKSQSTRNKNSANYRNVDAQAKQAYRDNQNAKNYYEDKNRYNNNSGRNQNTTIDSYYESQRNSSNGNGTNNGGRKTYIRSTRPNTTSPNR